MRYHVGEWSLGPGSADLDQLARLWNANAGGRHAFFPWTGERLAAALAPPERSPARLLEARSADGRLIGAAHVNQVVEDGYPWAGVVEFLLVDASWRGKGVGTALLEYGLRRIATFSPRVQFVDALGAWPFGYTFNTLLDGSERSGVFLTEAPLYRLFRRAGFHPMRKSLVMRAELSRAAPRPAPRGSAFHIEVRSGRTWLDRVFRGRTLWDHDMSRWDGRLLSRAIFGLMEGESRREGRAIYSLFGVNTPREFQRNGYAGVNLSHLMAHVRGLGGEVMELHVYADNPPALALYDSLGFRKVAETVMMHKLLAKAGPRP